MSHSNFEPELLELLREIRNELRIIRYTKQVEVSETRSEKLDALIKHDVELEKYDSSIRIK